MAESAVIDALQRGLGSHAGKMVAAVSGGTDSVALLTALHQLQSDVIVAHINHRLRGEASDRDELFVKELASKFGMPFCGVIADVAMASGGRNIEATARRLRYQALRTIAVETGASTIVTGHTADDQAETVLHRMIRGAGICGLAGILPRSRRAGITTSRPLLSVRRHEILTYLEARRQDFRTDETNLSPQFTRNRIRAEVMPLLESFNSGVVNHLCRLAELARKARRAEFRQARQLLASCERPRSGDLCVLDQAKLLQLPADRLPLMWRYLWRRERWPRDGMGFREWSRLADFVRGNVPAMDLPGNIRVRLLPRIVRVGPGA
ncbi:MAG: tRNA lysidine(34) synthetase TilS [Gemmataceae bacterium]